MWEEKSSFKNTPRDFTQVFRGKITNTEVESTVGEILYEGAACVQGSSFGRVAVEVTLTQSSSHPTEKNDLLFKDPRQDFELILATLSRTEKITGTHFTDEDPPSRVGQLSRVITWQPETNLTLRPSPPHSTCCTLGSLSIVVITSQHLSYQASPPSSPEHHHLLVHWPTSRCILLYHWWHPASENGSNYLAVGPFHFYV